MHHQLGDSAALHLVPLASREGLSVTAVPQWCEPWQRPTREVNAIPGRGPNGERNAQRPERGTGSLSQEGRKLFFVSGLRLFLGCRIGGLWPVRRRLAGSALGSHCWGRRLRLLWWLLALHVAPALVERALLDHEARSM